MFIKSKVFLSWEFNYLVDSGVSKRVIVSERAGAYLLLLAASQCLILPLEVHLFLFRKSRALGLGIIAEEGEGRFSEPEEQAVSVRLPVCKKGQKINS